MTHPRREDQNNTGNESCKTLLRRQLRSRDGNEGLACAPDLPLEFLENRHASAQCQRPCVELCVPLAKISTSHDAYACCARKQRIHFSQTKGATRW